MSRDRYRITRWLIWVYILLLLFEGALRKWVVPGLSNPLLLIRDPVVVLIYVTALADGSFPMTSGWLYSIVILAVAAVGAAFLAEMVNLKVLAFGFRTNFLHLPLILVMGRALNIEDIKWLGKWLLIISIPMAYLMMAQFRVGQFHWLNAGAGKDGGQIISISGKVRASGTFSFITGPVAMYALIAAFLLYGQLQKKAYKSWLTFKATGTLALACAVAGSRSLLGSVMLVLGTFLIAIMFHPPSFARAFRVVLFGAIAYLGVSLLDVFQEASQVMKKRIEYASHTDTYAERIFGFFYMPLGSVPIFGRGLGMGTNAGAAIMGKKGTFLLMAENEWHRVVAESGPIVGLAFVLWRVALALYLFYLAAIQARLGNLLPMLLWGSTFSNLVIGQFGPPTVLGFAVIAAGCTMAAMNAGPVVDSKAADGVGRKRNVREAAAAPQSQPGHRQPVAQPGRWSVRPEEARNTSG